MEFTLTPFAPPDGDALLRRISSHLDDRLLEHIARSDYEMDLEKNRAELRLIRDQGLIKKPLPWPPREVLNLVRWSEPAIGSSSGRTEIIDGVAGHWARAFCCAALLRAYGDAETRKYEDGYNMTLVQLLDSLAHIPVDLTTETLSLLTWLLACYDNDPSERAFVGVAILHLVLQTKVDVHDDDLLRFSDWLVGEEARGFNAWGKGIGEMPEHWLLRTTFFTLRGEKWIAIGRALANAELTGADTARKANEGKKKGVAAARAIGMRLANGS